MTGKHTNFAIPRGLHILHIEHCLRVIGSHLLDVSPKPPFGRHSPRFAHVPHLMNFAVAMEHHPTRRQEDVGQRRHSMLELRGDGEAFEREVPNAVVYAGGKRVRVVDEAAGHDADVGQAGTLYPREQCLLYMCGCW